MHSIELFFNYFYTSKINKEDLTSMEYISYCINYKPVSIIQLTEAKKSKKKKKTYQIVF